MSNESRALYLAPPDHEHDAPRAGNDNGFTLLHDPTEEALRALGQDILEEPVPDHLLALLMDDA